MEKAIVSIAFDDGSKVDTDAIELMNQLNIPATFFICTGFVENKMEMGDILPMSMAEVMALSQDSRYEIASHGYYHKNNIVDIRRGIKRLEELGMYDSNYKIGFASPGSELQPAEIRSRAPLYKKNKIAYVRIGSRFTSHPVWRLLCRRGSRILRLNSLFSCAYRETLMQERDGMIIYSVPVLHEIEAKQICHLIDIAIQEKKLCVLMFHSITNKQEKGYHSHWAWETKRFASVIHYIARKRELGQLEIHTVMNAYGELPRTCNEVGWEKRKWRTKNEKE